MSVQFQNNKEVKPSTNSFALQYMSLILIVLAFCVGAFLRGPKTAEAAVELPKTERVHLLTDISFKNLFKGTELDDGQLETVLTLVKSHDIRAELSLFPESDSDADYYLALSRAITLNTFFNNNLPREGWRIYVSGAVNKNQALVKFFSLDDVYGKLETNSNPQLDNDAELTIDKLTATQGSKEDFEIDEQGNIVELR
jgi:hypothetical protein